MLNRESVFRGDAALTARQRQTVVFVGGIVAVVGAIVLSFTGVISALLHRDDPLAMQAVASDGTVTTDTADGSADASFDLAPSELGGADAGAGAGIPGDPAAAPAAGGGGRFTGTYKPPKGGAPSPLAPTVTTVAPPAGDPGSTAPTIEGPATTTVATPVEPSVSTTTTGTSSSTPSTSRPTTTTTSRVTVTEATVPSTAPTLPPTTAPPTTAPPTTTPPTSPPVVPGPIA